MRGTLLRTFDEHYMFGIIPAYAGNTKVSTTAYCRVWDHPRVCGEHDSEGYQRSRRQGSSPRMRGTPFDSTDTKTPAGIIPAYAGNTTLRLS